TANSGRSRFASCSTSSAVPSSRSASSRQLAACTRCRRTASTSSASVASSISFLRPRLSRTAGRYLPSLSVISHHSNLHSRRVLSDATVFGCDQELGVAGTRAGRDARGERLDRVRLVDHRAGGLGPNDGVVYGGERDPADSGDPRRVSYLSCPDREHVSEPRAS